ncbi:Alpha/Beta hydrolase protein [Pyrenochaeta sp. MPI-SDFR-AT-0127]|nr:Alpha/Beta hydrolase protein [Pyrenochaeta sp. MPI-SDFR-AT-0127]
MTQKMRHPPEPHYSFTIPSTHDDTTLNCRIYYPDILDRSDASERENEAQWRKKGIIMAHPYAPMGGSYDDRVVGIVVDEFLKAGWVVGTFNFRGAHGSKGRTSWSGKPELDDYSSFAAFFMYFMSHIKPFPATDATFIPEQSPILPQAQSLHDISQNQSDQNPVVLLGGYSYGSLILKHLPPVSVILQPFETPIAGSAADEILLRARKLADQSNLDWINAAQEHAREMRRKKHAQEPKLSVTMGGEEMSPDKRRSSREIRRSFDGSRSLNLKTRWRSLSHRRREEGSPVTPPEERNNVAMTTPDVRYLLISPLTTPVSTLAAPALGPKFWNRSKDGNQEVVGRHTTLAIYGDQDVFTSAKKTRDWSEQLKAEVGSQFSSIEVEGAGHFWVEKGVEEKLRSALRDWGARI